MNYRSINLIFLHRFCFAFARTGACCGHCARQKQKASRQLQPSEIKQIAEKIKEAKEEFFHTLSFSEAFTVSECDESGIGLGS